MMIRATILFLLQLQAILASSYLVSLKPSETFESFFKYDSNRPNSQRIKAFIDRSFSIGSFKGFSGEFSKSLLEKLKSCPLVADVTPDITIQAYDIGVQEDAPRHLARLSQMKRIGSDPLSYHYNLESQGQGVNAYVLDSGVEISHPEFEGRAKFGMDFTKEGSGDTNGHGTHVAGIIGSKTYGVAKKVEVIEIKALDKSGAGALSTIISAIEFAVNHRKRSGKNGVANLSLGAAKNSVLNRAIDAAVKTGLIMVVAAGNSNINACMTSPASASSAITVGAIDDWNDSLASFSNWGECVDIFASGTFVSSVNAHDVNNPQILSGTSMSAPLVTGYIATLLSEGIKPSEIKDITINMAVKDRISRSSMFLRRKTPNRIVYNGLEPSEDTDDTNYDSDSE